MLPTDRLEEEHEKIRKVLAAIRDTAHKGADADADFLRDAIDFAQNFADDFHHAKEEKILFKHMADNGMPREHSPIGMMEHEHDIMRTLVQTAAKELSKDDPDVAKAAEHLDKFAETLQEHIHKENTILYPMANRLFTPDIQEGLEKEFDEADAAFDDGYKENYFSFAEEQVAEPA